MPQRPLAQDAPDLGPPAVNPLALDPLALALMQQQGQPQAPTASPAAQPQTAPQPTAPQAPNDPLGLAQQAQQRGLQEMTTQLGMERTPIQKAQELATAPWQTPDPKYGFQFSHNPFLRSIEAFLAGTGPGQGIEEALHGGGRAARAAEMKSRSQEIEALVGKEGVAGAAAQPMGALSGLTYHPMMAAARAESAGAAVMNAQNRAIHDRAMEGLRSQMQAIQQQLGQGKLSMEAARTAAMRAIGAGHDQAIRDVAGTHADQADRDAQIKAFEEEYKVNTDNMFKQIFGGMLGVGQTAPSQNPAAPPGPKAQGSAANRKAGGSQRFVSGGTTYNIPADQVDAFLKDHPNAQRR